MENQENQTENILDNKERAYATGKRKNSIARVWLKRGNGDIKINRTYVIDSGMKCSDYISTMNITTQWPIAGINRSTEFGTACQHPDGVWEVVNATS